MFIAETVSSDSLFCAYECETLETWFRIDSDSAAKWSRSIHTNELVILIRYLKRSCENLDLKCFYKNLDP